MAGMLPGVEAARRRGFHRSHANNHTASASRRPSFCLYVTNNQEFHFASRSSLDGSLSRPAVSDDDEMLDVSVREAKKRLDQRLHCKSGNKRKVKGQETLGSAEETQERVDSPRNLYKLILNLKSG